VKTKYLGPAAELTLTNDTVVRPGDTADIARATIAVLERAGHRFDPSSDTAASDEADAPDKDDEADEDGTAAAADKE
jgi:hypothetical protein